MYLSIITAVFWRENSWSSLAHPSAAGFLLVKNLQPIKLLTFLTWHDPNVNTDTLATHFLHIKKNIEKLFVTKPSTTCFSNTWKVREKKKIEIKNHQRLLLILILWEYSSLRSSFIFMHFSLQVHFTTQEKRNLYH